ncbi:hypothetical protein ACFL2D_01215 [Patescibacteria group bacterium]
MKEKIARLLQGENAIVIGGLIGGIVATVHSCCISSINLSIIFFWAVVVIILTALIYNFTTQKRDKSKKGDDKQEYDFNSHLW